MAEITHYHRRRSPSPPPPPHHDPHGPHSPRHFLKNLTEKVDFGEDVDFVVGVTATALTADQLIKQTTCKDHKVMHLAKAGLGAAVAATAFTMMSREHDQRKHADQKHKNHHGHRFPVRHPRGRTHRKRSRSSSSSSRSPPRLLSETNLREREEKWAVVRSRSSDPYERVTPPIPRSASVGARTHRDNYYYGRSHRPYYSGDESDDYERSDSESPDRRRGPRRRAYSDAEHRGERSASPGTLKKLWKVVRDGMETYERYDRSRRS